MRTEWWEKIQIDAEPDRPARKASSPTKHPGICAIVFGGLIAGACDLTYAISFYTAQGVKPIRIPQSIASGLLGIGSYKAGWVSASLGIALHFFIAFSAAAIYYFSSRKLTMLVRWAPICGAVYGAAIYFFMRWVVVPLSAAPHFKSTWLSDWTDFGVHVFLIGLPIALLARHYGSQDPGRTGSFGNR
jgi:hypothetical protein